MRSARIVYTARASTSPRHASRSRAIAGVDRPVARGSAEMRHHLALATFVERDVERREVSTDPFTTLLDDPRESILVKTCCNRDQLVVSRCDHVIAQKSGLSSQMIGPAFVHHSDDLVALTGTDLVPPDADEHSTLSSLPVSGQGQLKSALSLGRGASDVQIGKLDRDEM